ncbi:MAG: RNA polymerase subunit sigma-24 [candidate division Zixibacteria bacterium CG_4_9_14_3_um_filter_46_8]|nr:MAG: RNA polymerase subunit sigma-24 [candidate division Zixibacteria bacterium CG_4_9_14_3_um_filter_46_8]
MNDECRVTIQMILAGNKDAFKSFVEEYQRLVSHIVFKMVTNRADREDICQDVFIKVYENLGSFRFESKISTWIAQIAYNASVSYLRKNKLTINDNPAIEADVVQYISDGGCTPADYTESRDTSLRLAIEIDRIPALYGTILSLYHLEEMSYAEIGQVMRMPEGTVKSYLFRARKLLKERLLAKYQREEL